jgi:hypothetical protein
MKTVLSMIPSMDNVLKQKALQQEQIDNLEVQLADLKDKLERIRISPPPVEPVESVKPVEPIKPVEPVKPVKPTKQIERQPAEQVVTRIETVVIPDNATTDADLQSVRDEINDRFNNLMN